MKNFYFFCLQYRIKKINLLLIMVNNKIERGEHARIIDRR